MKDVVDLYRALGLEVVGPVKVVYNLDNGLWEVKAKAKMEDRELEFQAWAQTPLALEAILLKEKLEQLQEPRVGFPVPLCAVGREVQSLCLI